MGLKSLFFTDTTVENQRSDIKEEMNSSSMSNTSKTTFPTTFPTATPSFGASNDNPHLAKFLDAYQHCLDTANQSGYDFYEFFQAILNSGGVDNPQMYIMAMSMGVAMDKTCNKNKLLSQADYYLSEINKVYEQNVASGTAKRQELTTQKESENQNLTAELSNLKEQLEAIQNQINSAQIKLSSVDGKYQPLINEVEQKIQANETAKNVITSNINKVKQGINNIIK